MGSLAIKAENLSKQYLITKKASKSQRYYYGSFRDALSGSLTKPFRFIKNQLANNKTKPVLNQEMFWALENLSFEINKGEVVGVIGRNGAGKSTLLKILSRITEPTKGEAFIYGRVGSLLEIGSGFHPELTGRENIFLNGSILGMKRKEIHSEFDAIIDFSEIENYIDTPVKFYSSGMYMRLAFAVAAHMNPEILIVDEVLAVGDQKFQKKCLGKMKNVSKEGKTVIFVSHDMSAINELCDRAMLLHKGQMVSQGGTKEIIDEYLVSSVRNVALKEWDYETAQGIPSLKLRSVKILDSKNNLNYTFTHDEEVRLSMEYWVIAKTQVVPHFQVHTNTGTYLFSTTNHHDQEWSKRSYKEGLYQMVVTIPKYLLNSGIYQVHVYLHTYPDDHLIYLPDVVSFHIIDDGKNRGNFKGDWPGVIRPLLNWQGKKL